jgi:hypothetical protein
MCKVVWYNNANKRGVRAIGNDGPLGAVALMFGSWLASAKCTSVEESYLEGGQSSVFKLK